MADEGGDIASSETESRSRGSSEQPGLMERDRCPICLEDFEKRTCLDKCFHEFCYVCILQWAERSRACPLCKTSFSCLIFDIRSDADYQTHALPPLEKKAPARPPRPLPEYRMGSVRYRTTRTTPAVARPTISPRMAASKERRKLVYSLGLRSRHVGANKYSKFRNITPGAFRQRPHMARRLVPWIVRDLQVILSDDDVDLVLTFVLSLLEQVDVQSEEFVQQLRPFLLDKTQHFVHELLNFMRSPYDMIGFDEAVQYDWPTHMRDPLQTFRLLPSTTHVTSQPLPTCSSDNDTWRTREDSPGLPTSVPDQLYGAIPSRAPAPAVQPTSNGHPPATSQPPATIPAANGSTMQTVLAPGSATWSDDEARSTRSWSRGSADPQQSQSRERAGREHERSRRPASRSNSRERKRQNSERSETSATRSQSIERERRKSERSRRSPSRSTISDSKRRKSERSARSESRSPNRYREQRKPERSLDGKRRGKEKRRDDSPTPYTVSRDGNGIVYGSKDKPDEYTLPKTEEGLRQALHDVTEQLRARRRELLATKLEREVEFGEQRPLRHNDVIPGGPVILATRIPITGVAEP